MDSSSCAHSNTEQTLMHEHDTPTTRITPFFDIECIGKGAPLLANGRLVGEGILDHLCMHDAATGISSA